MWTLGTLLHTAQSASLLMGVDDIRGGYLIESTSNPTIWGLYFIKHLHGVVVGVEGRGRLWLLPPVRASDQSIHARRTITWLGFVGCRGQGFEKVYFYKGFKF